jgi:putative hemolysin
MNQEPPLGDLFLILFIILLNGFFTLAETALVSSRKPRLRAKAVGGGRKYLKALEGLENSGALLFSMRIWINALGILAGTLGGLSVAAYLKPRFEALEGLAPYGAPLALLLTAAGIILPAVFLGQFIPRQIALLFPEGIFAFLFPCLKVLTVLISPLNGLSSRFQGFLRGLFKLEGASGSGMTEDELRLALAEGEKSGIVESEERTMVEGVFYLGDRPVETFMTHRSELRWLDIHTGAEEARSAVAAERDQGDFPVVTDTLDEVVGVASARDILLALQEEPWKGLGSIMKPPRFVPKTMSALKAFESFKREDTDLLCVMDEYGGFAGALTVKNLIEEIVGELSGSPGEDEALLLQEDGTYLADGSGNIDDIAELLGFAELLGEHQEYHTLAGFILHLAEAIPRTGAVFEWEGFRFKILDMDGNRIDKLLIYPPGESKAEGA